MDHGVIPNHPRLCFLSESERAISSVAPQIERKVTVDLGAVHVWSGLPTAENAAGERYDNGDAANEERGADLYIYDERCHLSAQIMMSKAKKWCVVLQ